VPASGASAPDVETTNHRHRRTRRAELMAIQNATTLPKLHFWGMGVHRNARHMAIRVCSALLVLGTLTVLWGAVATADARYPQYPRTHITPHQAVLVYEGLECAGKMRWLKNGTGELTIDRFDCGYGYLEEGISQKQCAESLVRDFWGNSYPVRRCGKKTRTSAWRIEFLDQHERCTHLHARRTPRHPAATADDEPAKYHPKTSFDRGQGVLVYEGVECLGQVSWTERSGDPRRAELLISASQCGTASGPPITQAQCPRARVVSFWGDLPVSECGARDIAGWWRILFHVPPD
jgi:hypothetical protein